MKVPSRLLLIFSLLFSANVSSDNDNVAASQPNPTVQVLLQGKDPEKLRQALRDFGGLVTHELPIVSGVGGIIRATELANLAETKGVVRLTEDFNPPKLPEARDCLLAGDLQIQLTPQSLRWRIFNFDTNSRELKWLWTTWPRALGDATLSITPELTSSLTVQRLKLESGARSNLDFMLPPGPALVDIQFSSSPESLSQNDFQISLGLNDCEAVLIPAYSGDGQDFYFQKESGTTLLTQAGLTGSGIGVAIIDSGLWDIPALTHNAHGEARIATHYNAIRDQIDLNLRDEGGHGSHMASIIANSRRVANRDPAQFQGLAPNAVLIPVTAISPRGDGDFMDIIRGIQWVTNNQERFNIRVLNLSLTATPRSEYWVDPMNQAVMKAWEAGIAVVVAAGNDGPDWGTIGSPGNNPYVITVGAFTDSWTPGDGRDDYIPNFSSRGPTPEGFIKPDFVAPGGHISGLIPPDSTLAMENPNYFLTSGEFVSTGSSQAAAVVSGLIALLLEIKPELSNDDVKCLLTTSAQPALSRTGKLAYSPFIQGAGRVNGSRALTLGKTDCEQKKLNINAAVAGTERLYGPAERLEDGTPSLPDMPSMVEKDTPTLGISTDRRWGVAEHLERLDPATEPPQKPGVPFDWAAVYREEQKQLNRLKAAPSN
ncbi:MAG: S8 family peptidase [Luminiphilus sp.]|nr:S8 family peptidase [Luminiphilus sp.]